MFLFWLFLLWLCKFGVVLVVAAAAAAVVLHVTVDYPQLEMNNNNNMQQ